VETVWLGTATTDTVLKGLFGMVPAVGMVLFFSSSVYWRRLYCRTEGREYQTAVNRPRQRDIPAEPSWGFCPTVYDTSDPSDRSDFDSQGVAQQILENNPHEDPPGFDGNDDGEACGLL